MDELDVPQLQQEVESLKFQLQVGREKTSVTIAELVQWIEEGVASDPFLNADLMKNNPWVESGKCVVL
ncbi:guanine nucleotide-binding protein G(I)/G(S)/G(O) subunit gamma-13a [Denticeps clupeoides]|uniref:guanine nucleotide-binding protein G(I)/G(S)/G(O) subunit gamma-13-like n=1 Tax=Denticeps clupeoides TaxID=299321 RepID=UPI0010A3A731|nr:guanine nucleotide-binding protein G(I)/G(S)/G(O) subunit gamma-13-like [Denticeps clupeoides]XP_028822864.1 guanine nucleotide-binding protein G(I)/G(S)/G(O) subunit gamma-13-like [Denticeps clupeoides]XP_028828389.1 guanine nucleotide-binding protein G(I)/G(S)/G(O) subunit gamma-13-like [Denticeps clupeoides]XP_028828391.1 guanine nucleotide-binding protein G(I)/G(S)/G(O) subunit gamma-13-like [Denticeps clupeoides]